MTRRQIEKTVAYSLLLIAIIFAVYLGQKSAQLCINLIIGLFFGMIMSRTAFSFTGNLRGPIMDKDYSYTRLFFLMTVITCIGINLAIFIGTLNGSFDWNSFIKDKPTPFSIYFLIAAVIFGFGICLVGSAGSGIIRKAVNAKAEFIITLIFYFLGSVCGVIVRNQALTIFNERTLYMPEMFGWPLAITIQGIALAACFLFLKWQKAKEEEDAQED